MNEAVDKLTQVSKELTRTAISGYGDLLVRRRAALDAVTADGPFAADGLAAATVAGDEARSLLLFELGALRAKIDELRRVRTGLGRFRPSPPGTASLLDVRL